MTTFYSTIPEEDVEFFLQLENEWRDKLPVNNFHQWIAIFPEAKSVIKKKLKEEIKQCKKDLVESVRIKNLLMPLVNKTPYKEQWFHQMMTEIFFINDLREGKEQKIKRNTFYLSVLNAKENKNSNNKKFNNISEGDIMQARDIPLENIYQGHLHKVGGRATGLCPFHDEKTGSFTIYLKQNTWYCFGCSCGGDVIDFICKQNNVNFINAVKILINK